MEYLHKPVSATERMCDRPEVLYVALTDNAARSSIAIHTYTTYVFNIVPGHTYQLYANPRSMADSRHGVHETNIRCFDQV
jgi:hypothetical protein